jgi:HlyD family secretion protein
MKIHLLAITLLLCLSNCSDKNNQQALGTLERDRVVLKATAAEIILAEPIREGSLVKKGDLLVQLDDTQAQANLRKVEARLTNAKANQTKLRNGARAEDVAATRAQLDRAQAQVVQANANYSRVAKLLQQKMIGQADVDNARSLRDSAQADVRRANQNLLALTNGTRPEDLLTADAQVAEAEADIAIAHYTLSQLSVTATRDGFLDRLPKHVGERAAINDPLAILLTGDAPYARVYILEPARAKLQVGQTFKIHVDGYEKSFDGKLRWISQDPAFTPYYGLNARDRSLLMYLAEIDLPETAKDLPSGLPVQVDIPLEPHTPSEKLQ